jgi:PAS domain S-box-containing protein
MNSTPSPAESRILVIDDAVAIHEDFRKILRTPRSAAPALLAARAKLFGSAPARPAMTSFTVDCASQGEEGLELVRRARAEERPYSIAFVDMRMPPGWDGIETTRHLWAVDPALQVVICSAYSDHTWEDTATQLGTTDNLLILKKPFDNIEVLQIAHALSSKWMMARRNRERLANLDECVRQRTVELVEAEGRFARAFQANPVATTLQNLSDGKYVDANPAFLALAGCTHDDVIYRSPAELGLWTPDDVWQRIVASLDANTPLRSAEARLRAKDGGIRDVLVWVQRVEIGRQVCVLTSIQDVTERLLLEKKFQQAQKMEAVGQLAAGIAHDFNNLLTVIHSYTALVLEDVQLGGDNREALSQVRTAAGRAAALTRQLLIFSRREIAHSEPVDLAVTFMHMQEMLRRLMPEHIQLVWHCDPPLPLILADEANLEQVIMNLVVNARDAMPGGGRIRFSVDPVTLKEADVVRHPDGRAGEFVRLSIADTGVGMTADVVAHIFEPFFTTKGLGKGTGLGLSTVYAIVHQHSGWLEVTSSPGKGTTFDIFLPTVGGSGSGTAVHAPDIHEPVSTSGRGERVLLVEDEPSVRLATRTIITRAGYEVVDAVDAPNALQAWTEARMPFDLLLTDMVMPNGSNGMELATRLRSGNPRLKVIISTGYSQELMRQTGPSVPGARLLLKPFTTASLLTTIREALDSPT